jgi:hypothetical protein
MFITTAGGGMIASSLLGGLLGGSSDANSATTTQQAQLDPRMADYLYGGGGLLGGVRNLYQQQIGQGGLNPMQTAGLELQRRTLMNPAYTQGFDQMRNVGAGLMGGGVAGNPFGNTMGQPQMQQMPGGRWPSVDPDCAGSFKLARLSRGCDSQYVPAHRPARGGVSADPAGAGSCAGARRVSAGGRHDQEIQPERGWLAVLRLQAG